MLTSINPLVERSRKQRWGITISFYLLGSIVGGALVGSALGALGQLVRPDLVGDVAATALVVAIGTLALSHDLTGRPGLPGPTRQVNEDWLARYRGWVYGLGFGLQLGSGVTTKIVTGLVHLMLLLMVLVGDWRLGAVIGMTFGLVRALAILAMAGVSSPDSLRLRYRQVLHVAPVARTFAVATLGTSLGVAAVAGW